MSRYGRARLAHATVALVLALWCLMCLGAVSHAEDGSQAAGAGEAVAAFQANSSRSDSSPDAPVVTAAREETSPEVPQPQGSKMGVVDWAQIAASLATAVALGFLVWQSVLMRRQTRALNQSIRSATYQSIASFYIDINKSLSTEPSIAAAFDSFGNAEPNEDVAVERQRKWLAFWLLNLYENAYIQHEFGVLPTTVWSGIETDFIEQMDKPYIAMMWSRSGHLFSEEFRQHALEKRRSRSRATVADDGAVG